MSGYIGPAPVPQATQTRETFTATASQTSFATAGYTVGFLDVYLNGVHLVDGDDYTASNGSDVVLSSGATAGDILEVVAYKPFEVVDQNFTGDFSVDTDTLYVDSANNRVGIGRSSPDYKLELEDIAPVFISLKSSSTTGVLFGDADAPARGGILYDNTDNSLAFRTNTNTERMRIDSDGNVGIGTSSPAKTLEVVGDARIESGLFEVRKAQEGGVGPRINLENRNNSSPTGNGGEIRFIHGNDSGRSYRIRTASTGSFGRSPDMIFESENDGGGVVERMRIDSSGNLDVNGSLSKNSGSFKIDHPVKPDTHHLVHSFVEGPQADNLYRGKAALVDGSATVNLDEAGRMTEGTFVALNGNVQCWTTNEDGWTQVRGKVEGNTLTIEAQDPACTDEVSWLVIGERHDQHMIETEWTDENGRVITEPAKENTQ